MPLRGGGLAFVAGLVLLFSGSLPGVPSRLHSLKQVVGLPLIETSHLIGSIAGVTLLILARGLLRRFQNAWLATMALLAAGVVASLTKGVALEEAAILALHRRSTSLRLRSGLLSEKRLFGAAAFTTLVRDGAGRRRRRDLARLLQLPPRRICERALVAIRLARQRSALPAGERRRRGDPRLGRHLDTDPSYAGRLQARPGRRHVRRLVAASPRSQANVALLGDKKFILAPDASAFLMYGRLGSSWISMGDPIGDPAGRGRT